MKIETKSKWPGMTLQMEEKGKCIITRSELVDCHGPLVGFLPILKKKGVPVLGCCALRLDPAYRYVTSEDFDTGDYSVKWEKI